MVAAAGNRGIWSEVSTLPELLAARTAKTPDRVGLADRWGFDAWRNTTWKEFAHAVELAAAQLRSYGCKPGDAIAVVASSSIYWDITQYAILKNGGIVVGIDIHDNSENINIILETARIKGIVTDNADCLSRFDSAWVEGLSFVLQFSPCDKLETFSYSPLPKSAHSSSALCVDSWPNISSDDLAIIIFTSGTTGKPKGIPYTHRQILIACGAITAAYADVAENARLVCWLPLSNLFQRMMNYCALGISALTYYVARPQELTRYLVEINPTVLIAVPRFYEKVHEGVQVKMAQTAWPARTIFLTFHRMRQWAMKNNRHSWLFRLVVKITDILVFKHFRRRIFGTELKYAISGSAPMPVWLLEWFAAAGVLILEAYGISENIVPVACNTPECHRFGSVGRPLAPNEVRLSADGEIEVKGPGLLSGYLPETPDSRNITPDGYLQTGDEGSTDAQGFIVLHGRKGDFFKTSTGRRICPIAIEKEVSSHPRLDHVMVVGSGRKVPIVCATLAAGVFEKDLAQLEQLRDELLVKISEHVSEQQKPAALLLLLTEFTINGGELTASLKVRRKFVEEKYGGAIEDCYDFLQKSPRENIHHHRGGNAITVLL